MTIKAGADATGLAFAINPACFGKPGSQGAIGNLARNFIRQPSIFNNDVAIFKNIKLGERREIQLRWEVYNIFNHTNFSDFFGAMVFSPDAAVTALLADLRDYYASSLPVERAEEYEDVFNRAVRRRLPRFALEIEET